MALIFPSKKEMEYEKRKEEVFEDTKLVIYFKKTIDLVSDDDAAEFLRIIKEARALNLFDDIYIVKGKELEEITQFKDIFTAAALNEIKHIKDEQRRLNEILKHIVLVVKDLKEELYKLLLKVRE